MIRRLAALLLTAAVACQASAPAVAPSASVEPVAASPSPGAASSPPTATTRTAAAPTAITVRVAAPTATSDRDRIPPSRTELSGDFDGDGRMDLLTLTLERSTQDLRRAKISFGSGLVHEQVLSEVSYSPETRLVADVDRDGKDEIFIRLDHGASTEFMDPVVYRFDVERVLKGAVNANAEVHSVVSGASCGLERMEVSERYTVFARLDDGDLRSGLCDGTSPGDPDPLVAAFTGTLLPAEQDPPPPWAFGAVILAAALAVGGWRVTGRRDRATRTS